jgi:hypothetical protein
MLERYKGIVEDWHIIKDQNEQGSKNTNVETGEDENEATEADLS